MQPVKCLFVKEMLSLLLQLRSILRASLGLCTLVKVPQPIESLVRFTLDS